MHLNISMENALFEDSNVGQIVSEGHVQINGHINVSRLTVMMTSGIQKNLHEEDPDNFDPRIFKLGFIRSCKFIDFKIIKRELIDL